MCFLFLQPVELLHKPLAEFEDELLPKGVLLRTVYAVYDDHEADRQSKAHVTLSIFLACPRKSPLNTKLVTEKNLLVLIKKLNSLPIFMFFMPVRGHVPFNSTSLVPNKRTVLNVKPCDNIQTESMARDTEQGSC